MKLLCISVVLLILHIQFNRMEQNTNRTYKGLSSVGNNSDSNNDSCAAVKQPFKLLSCSLDSQIVNEADVAAAQNATQQAKLVMADKALAANFLVEGKQAIADKLAKKLTEVEAVVEQIKASLETSQANVKITCAALRMGDKLNATMLTVVDEMRSNIKHLVILIDQTQADLEEQNQMMAEAKDLDDQLSQELAEAKAQYEKVKVACRVVSAALEAHLKGSSSPDVAAA